MDQASDRELLRRAESAYIEFFRALARTAPQAAIREHDGLTLVYSGPWLPQLNLAAVERVDDEPAACIQSAIEFFAGHRQRFALAAPAELAPRLAPVASAMGL